MRPLKLPAWAAQLALGLMFLLSCVSNALFAYALIRHPVATSRWLGEFYKLLGR